MQNVFYIFGVAVYTRRLGSGDLVVWHRYHDAVRKVVEPICRDRGYWNPIYKNWVVFARFGGQVLADLRARGRRS